jgi:O-antigen/teichoic acid export membrane protein
MPRLTIGQATLAALLADGVAVIATIVATPYLIGQLGTAPYGIIVAVMVLLSQMSALQLGLGPAAARLLAESRGSGDPHRRAALFSAVFVAICVAAALFAIGIAVVAPWAWTGAFNTDPALVPLAMAAVPAAVAIAAAQPVLVALHGLLMGEERFAPSAAIRGAHGVLRIAAAVAAVAAGTGVVGVLWAYVAMDVCAVVALAGVTGGGFTARPSIAELRSALAQLARVSLPFAAADIFAAILVDVEKVALGVTHSLEALTYYTVPFNAVFRLVMFATALSGVLLPRISAVGAGGANADAALLVRQATRLTTVIMAVFCAPIIAIAPELLNLWLGADFAQNAGLATRLLLVGVFINGTVYAAHAAIRARAHPATLPVLYAAETILHIGVVVVAVRLWGIPGAAAAWTLRIVVDAVAHRWLAARALAATFGSWIGYLWPAAAIAVLGAVCEVGGETVPALARLALGLGFAIGIGACLLRAADRRVVIHSLRPHRA